MAGWSVMSVEEDAAVVICFILLSSMVTAFVFMVTDTGRESCGESEIFDVKKEGCLSADVIEDGVYTELPADGKMNGGRVASRIGIETSTLRHTHGDMDRVACWYEDGGEWSGVLWCERVE